MNIFINHPDAPHFVQSITPDKVVLNSGTYAQSIIIFQDQVNPWTEDLAELAAYQPELVLLGTGQQQHFPDSALLKPLIQKQIGLEVMTNEAACRTFNLLIDDGRAVLLALTL